MRKVGGKGNTLAALHLTLSHPHPHPHTLHIGVGRTLAGASFNPSLLQQPVDHSNPAFSKVRISLVFPGFFI